MPLKYTCNLLLWVALCTGTYALAQPTSVDKIIVKVNARIVLKSALEEQFLGAQSGQSNLSQCELLQSLLYNNVLVTRAGLDSVEIADEQVEANLSQRINYVMAQIGSQEKLIALYGKSLADFKDEMREAVRDQLLVDKMKHQLVEKVQVTPREVHDFFHATPLDTRPYYATEVQLGQIVREIKPSKTAEQAIIDTLGALRKRILAGEDFALIARRHSEDPSVVSNSGRLGFFQQGALDPAYEAAALRLEAGEVSLPIRSHFGYHLIELLEIRGNTYDSRHILLLPKPTAADYAEHYAFLTKIREDIVTNTLPFEDVAKTYSEDIKTASNGGSFQANNGDTWMSVEDIDPLLFFMLDTMQVGDISLPIAFTTESGKAALRILYYKGRVAPHQASLSSDYLKLQTACLENKQNEVIAKWLKKTYEDIFVYIDPDYKHCDVYNLINQHEE